MSSSERFKIGLQYVLPKHLLSRLVGRFAAAKAGIFTQAFIRWFIKQYKIDMSEAIQEDPRDYATFNQFFTRRLKPELRPIVDEPDLLARSIHSPHKTYRISLPAMSESLQYLIPKSVQCRWYSLALPLLRVLAQFGRGPSHLQRAHGYNIGPTRHLDLKPFVSIKVKRWATLNSAPQ